MTTRFDAFSPFFDSLLICYFWSLQLRDGCECGEGRGCFDAYKVAGTCSRSWKEARLCRPSSSGKSLTCLSIMWFSTWNILSLDILSMLILMEFKLMLVVSTNADYLLLIYSGLIGTNFGCPTIEFGICKLLSAAYYYLFSAFHIHYILKHDFSAWIGFLNFIVYLDTSCSRLWLYNNG